MMKDLIFDLGMNNGDDSDFYLKKGFRVVAVEANPDLCALARRRFAPELESGRLHIFNQAISKTSGEIQLFINEQVSGWSTTNATYLKTRTSQGTHSRAVMVPAVTFDEIVRGFGMPYYVKADIQGAEISCLEALLLLEERPEFFSISTAGDALGIHAKGQTRLAIDLFSRLGYRKFKIVQQRDIELQTCPVPPLEGSYVDYKFPHGCSGLFGHELPGDWMDARQTMREYWKIMLSYQLSGSSPCPSAWFTALPSNKIRYYLDRLFWRGTGWYDLHAARNGSGTLERRG